MLGDECVGGDCVREKVVERVHTRPERGEILKRIGGCGRVGVRREPE